MVSKNMMEQGSIVQELDAEVYRMIAGELRGRLPGHVMIDVDRSKDEKGRSFVLLRCKQPRGASKAIADILGEVYIEPEIGEKGFPNKRKEWWQRGLGYADRGRWRNE